MSLALSPKEKHVACIHPDRNRIVVWNIETETCEFTLRDPEFGDITALAYSPDGWCLASTSHNKTARVWNVEDEKCVHVLEGHTDSVWAVCYSPKGTQIATGSWDNTARIWDADTGACVRVLEGHTAPIMSLCYSPDGTQIATASGGPNSDNTARVWDVKTGKCLRILRGHTNEILSIAFSPDGTRIATAGSYTKEQLIPCFMTNFKVMHERWCVWDAKTGECKGVTDGGMNSWYKCIGFSPDSSRVCVAGSEINVYDSFRRHVHVKHDTRGGISTPKCLRYTADGAYLVSFCGRNVRWWHSEFGTLVKTLSLTSSIDEPSASAKRRRVECC